MKTKMDEKFKTQGEYIRIIADIQQEKIKLTEYEKELIEDWGLPVLYRFSHYIVDYAENNIEEIQHGRTSVQC